MKRPMRFMVRCLALVVLALAVMPMLTAPASGTASPYLSALSDMTSPSVQAAPPTCPNYGCNSFGHCSRVKGFSCIYSAGECQATAC
jgi:hypothetical protein